MSFLVPAADTRLILRVYAVRRHVCLELVEEHSPALAFGFIGNASHPVFLSA